MRTPGPALAMAALALTAAHAPAGASPPPGGEPAAPPPPVVGGGPADAGKWDDAAAVFFEEEPGCTGTLIAPDLVVTAGHCISGVTSVKVGVTDLNAEGESIPVVNAIEHPDSFTTYDVGLLILERPAEVTPRVLATGCVLERYLADGAPVAIVGWGATDQQGERSTNLLMEAESSVTDIDCTSGRGCNASVSPGGELAAGGDNVDSCFGDSGGPLYLLTDVGEFLVGVTSRGYDDASVPCGEGGIYVRPDAVLDWIEAESGQSIPRATCNARPEATADATSLEVKSGDSVDAVLTVSDADTADAHTYAVGTAPTHGEASVDGDGVVTYRAGDDYEGADEFTVVVADDGIPSLSAEVAFEVNVLPGDGCGCRASSPGAAAPVLALLALMPLARRRRRRG